MMEGSVRPFARPGPSARYFALVALTFLLQIAGIVLVWQGRYRAGGAFQIASSAIHVLKGEGVVGLIGGLKAYRYYPGAK